jgi:uncharacterized protein (TIGR02453 family)
MPKLSSGNEQPATPAHFTPESLKFLRGLARNNDREWFEARRDVYERALRQPMLAVIVRVNELLASIAPEHIKPPEKTVLRIYRDTRFSANKQPYKQQYAAWWGHTGMVKTSGAGFYFHLSAKTLTIAAGLYMPDAAQLLAVRRYLLDHHEELRRLLTAPRLRKRMRISEPHALSRAPKGFPREHPGLDLILYRNWALEAELPAEIATQANFAATLMGHFRLCAPVVEFLNRPLAAGKPRRKPLFALSDE